MPQAKTSLSHPLRIDTVTSPGGGLIGMTLCPGKKQVGAVSGTWDRDLGLDLDRIRDWGAVAVVTLMEDPELDRYQVPGMGRFVMERNMVWYHLPIVDVNVPGASFEKAWTKAGPKLRANLAAGQNILLHCRGGLGRTGTIAARLMIELGVPADQAIVQIRQARRGAIETAAQEAYARRIWPIDAALPAPAAVHPKPSHDVADRARGALLGLAVGDALGTTIEFMPRDSYPMQAEMTGGGPFNLKPGQWTDDTSMALALAESLIAYPRFDAADLMDRFVRWWTEGAYSCTGRCFDIGITTRQALSRYRRTGMPFAGATDEHSAGNGSLMRLSPVALHALHDPANAARIAAEQSRTTHGAPQAVEACVWFADLLRRAILGEPKTSLLQANPRNGHPAMHDVTSGAWRGRRRAGIRSSGYVIHTLEAALWSVEQTGNFEDALVLAVNLGEDADTVGAVTGQLAGAVYGLSGIPARWTDPLAWRPNILALADALLESDARPAPG